MKPIVFILFLSFPCSFNSAAQTTPEEKLVLMEALNIVHYETPILYMKMIQMQPKGGRRDRIAEKIENGKFYNTVAINDSVFINEITGETTMYARSVDSLILSSEEKQQLMADFGKSVTWEVGLFEHSTRVDDYETGYQKLSAIEASMDDSQTRISHYIFSFGKPVFIRDSTICLVAAAAMCGGDCGIVDISFYRKANGRWERWISVAGGAF